MSPARPVPLVEVASQGEIAENETERGFQRKQRRDASKLTGLVLNSLLVANSKGQMVHHRWGHRDQDCRSSRMLPAARNVSADSTKCSTSSMNGIIVRRKWRVTFADAISATAIIRPKLAATTAAYICSSDKEERRYCQSCSNGKIASPQTNFRLKLKETLPSEANKNPWPGPQDFLPPANSCPLPMHRTDSGLKVRSGETHRLSAGGMVPTALDTRHIDGAVLYVSACHCENAKSHTCCLQQCCILYCYATTEPFFCLKCNTWYTQTRYRLRFCTEWRHTFAPFSKRHYGTARRSQ